MLKLKRFIPTLDKEELICFAQFYSLELPFVEFWILIVNL